MRPVIVFVSLLFAATLVCAQTRLPEPPSDLEIIKFSWSKERINWEKDPFAAPVEGFSEMRDRINTERRPRTALDERAARANKEGKVKPTEPPRYAFNYKLSVLNSGSKAIKEIDWDYIFTDSMTGEELGRRQFTSLEKIGAGKRKEFSIFVSSPPAQRISVYKLGNKEHDGLTENVSVIRILYDDASTWQAR